MPWKRPSSQPTSWACAIRSSPSDGVPSSVKGSESRSSSSTSSGARPTLELLDRGPVDLLEPVAAGLVERRGLHFLQQLPDHAADPHDLRGLLDQVGDALAAFVVVAVALALAGGCGVLRSGDDARGHRADRLAVGADHDDVLLLLALLLAHVSEPSRARGTSGRRGSPGRARPAAEERGPRRPCRDRAQPTGGPPAPPCRPPRPTRGVRGPRRPAPAAGCGG